MSFNNDAVAELIIMNFSSPAIYINGWVLTLSWLEDKLGGDQRRRLNFQIFTFCMCDKKAINMTNVVQI